MTTFDVYLAYHSSDEQVVENIARRLTALGVQPWFDKDEVIPGSKAVPVLEKGLLESKTCAVFFGVGGMGPWQTPESDAALRRCIQSGVPYIPVLLPGFDPATLPLFASGQNYVRFQTQDDEGALDSLFCGILQLPPRTLDDLAGNLSKRFPDEAALEPFLKDYELSLAGFSGSFQEQVRRVVPTLVAKRRSPLLLALLKEFPSSPLPPPPRKWRWPILGGILAGALALALVAFLVGFNSRPHAKEPPPVEFLQSTNIVSDKLTALDLAELHSLEKSKLIAIAVRIGPFATSQQITSIHIGTCLDVRLRGTGIQQHGTSRNTLNWVWDEDTSSLTLGKTDVAEGDVLFAYVGLKNSPIMEVILGHERGQRCILNVKVR